MGPLVERRGPYRGRWFGHWTRAKRPGSPPGGRKSSDDWSIWLSCSSGRKLCSNSTKRKMVRGTRSCAELGPSLPRLTAGARLDIS
jgi:hypothetical protein